MGRQFESDQWLTKTLFYESTRKTTIVTSTKLGLYGVQKVDKAYEPSSKEVEQTTQG